MPICKLNFTFLDFSNISVSSLNSFHIFLQRLLQSNEFLQTFFYFYSSGRKKSLDVHVASTQISENLRNLKRDIKGHLVLLSF